MSQSLSTSCAIVQDGRMNCRCNQADVHSCKAKGQPLHLPNANASNGLLCQANAGTQSPWIQCAAEPPTHDTLLPWPAGSNSLPCLQLATATERCDARACLPEEACLCLHGRMVRRACASACRQTRRACAHTLERGDAGGCVLPTVAPSSKRPNSRWRQSGRSIAHGTPHLKGPPHVASHAGSGEGDWRAFSRRAPAVSTTASA